MEVERMRGMFQGLDIAASGMTAEMVRADIVASNISNMHVTGGPGRDPYRRKTVVFEELLERGRGGLGDDAEVERKAGGVQVTGVYEDRVSPFVPRYEPGHPHADEKGFVMGSNVDLFREMVDMMSIERSFQANLAAMRSYRTMLRSSLDNMRS